MAYPILAPTNTWYKSSTARSTITQINIVNSYTPTGSENESWNADTGNTGSIKCYRTGTVLTIAGNGSGKIAMNADSSYLFSYAISSTSQLNQVFRSCTVINGLNLFDSSTVTNLRYAFAYCIALTELDLSSWDVSKVTTLQFAFGANQAVGTMALSTLNLSGWNITNSCTSIRAMCQSCASLVSLDVSNWDTSNVTEMRYAFYGCAALININVSNWNTSACTNMDSMFYHCSSLASLDVSNWNTSACTTFHDMFNDCTSLSNLDVSNWDTSSCTNMSFMFYSAYNIKNLDVSKWDVSKVTTFDHMTAHSGIVLNGVQNWRTPSAVNMNAMFHNIGNTVIDVSNLDTSNVQIFTQMFENARNLTRIIGLENFDTSNGLGFDDMFQRCVSLKELNLSSFDTRKAKDGVLASGNNSTTLTLLNMLLDTPKLEKITFGENFSFNGDGTTTVNALEIPTPSADNITGADGNWYTRLREPYAPADIPSKTAQTYYASLNLVNDIDYMIKNGTLLDIADAVRSKADIEEYVSPVQMMNTINNLKIDNYMNAEGVRF